MSTESTLQGKFALLSVVHEWIQRKLIAGEGFSVLLISEHSSGKKMSKYQRETVEAALEQCFNELSNELGDATAYALAFDARTKVKDELKPMLVFQIEQRGDGEATQLAQRYELRKKWFSSTTQYKPQEELRTLGSSEPWLVS